MDETNLQWDVDVPACPQSILSIQIHICVYIEVLTMHSVNYRAECKNSINGMEAKYQHSPPTSAFQVWFIITNQYVHVCYPFTD